MIANSVNVADGVVRCLVESQVLFVLAHLELELDVQFKNSRGP